MCSLNVDYSEFSVHLFWDTDRGLLDAEKNKSYIIKQVLEFGYDKDWKLLKSIYSLDEIKTAVMNMRALEKRAIGFIACITHTNIKDYRCYSTAQSNEAPWNY